MQWFNEPSEYTVDANGITLKADPKTDFWRTTHYGFVRDNGHFYYQPMSGDFSAEVKLIGQYVDLYDQGGLMIRQNERMWIKTGIEFVHGVQHLSAVVTRDVSDWSVVRLPDNPLAVWLRMVREGDAIQISYSLDGAAYYLLRMAYFGTEPQADVGIMAAAPDGDGFTMRFEDLDVRAHG